MFKDTYKKDNELIKPSQKLIKITYDKMRYYENKKLYTKRTKYFLIPIVSVIIVAITVYIFLDSKNNLTINNIKKFQLESMSYKTETISKNFTELKNKADVIVIGKANSDIKRLDYSIYRKFKVNKILKNLYSQKENSISIGETLAVCEPVDIKGSKYISDGYVVMDSQSSYLLFLKTGSNKKVDNNRTFGFISAGIGKFNIDKNAKVMTGDISEFNNFSEISKYERIEEFKEDTKSVNKIKTKALKEYKMR
jgi:hypothetical protein